jgi:hypothetical protein
MIYHGHKGLARENSKFILKDSKTKEDKYGTGAYFKKDPKMRKEIDVIAIDEKKLKTLKGDDEMPKKLVSELLMIYNLYIMMYTLRTQNSLWK